MTATPRYREAFNFKGGGAGIDTDKALAWNVARQYWERDDPHVNKADFAAARSRGGGVGIYYNNGFCAGHTPTELAAVIDEDLTRVGFSRQTPPGSCGVIINEELQGSARIIQVLGAWRNLRWARFTVWALGAYQGGWFTPELVQLLNADRNLIVAPEAYVGGPYVGLPPMYPAAVDTLTDDLADAGVARQKIAPVLYADWTVPYGWKGLLYNFAALPAKPPAPL